MKKFIDYLKTVILRSTNHKLIVAYLGCVFGARVPDGIVSAAAITLALAVAVGLADEFLDRVWTAITDKLRMAGML